MVLMICGESKTVPPKTQVEDVSSYRSYWLRLKSDFGVARSLISYLTMNSIGRCNERAFLLRGEVERRQQH